MSADEAEPGNGTLRTGHCLCGAIRYRVELPSLFCVVCHCGMCRRHHGADFVTWFGVPRERFALLEGSGSLQRYDSSDHGARFFCARCGTSLFCESTSRPGQVEIALGSFDGALDRAVQCHIHFDDRAPWTQVADDLPRLGGASGLEPLGLPKSD